MSGRAVDPALQRESMVQREVVGRGITDARVVDAMRRVPRHLFVDEALAGRAHEDAALPIGFKQTISRPHVVALMTELLGAGPDDRVLEIGTGSGYQAAVLSHLAAHVDSVERLPQLVRRARRILSLLHVLNVDLHESDGTEGLAALAPFDRIIVTAGAPSVPAALFDQLVEGGRLVLPVAEAEGGEVLQVIARIDGRPQVQRSVPCAFVPLIGAQGYREG